MSNPSKSSSTPHSSRKFIPTSAPIPLLPTKAAHLYHHIHPILILTLTYTFFPSLVADPVSTLTKLTFPIALLQIIYTTLCLPTAKAGALPKTAVRKRKPGEKRSKDVSVVWTRIVPSILSLLLSLLPTTPLLTIAVILFGAPLTTHIPHTTLCALHMSLLAFLPLFYVYGVDGRMWREICSASLPFDGVWGGTIGTVVGAWVGAVPIPLDWDREWQKWPVTIITGAYLGWAIGRLAGEFLFKGKRIEFD